MACKIFCSIFSLSEFKIFSFTSTFKGSWLPLIQTFTWISGNQLPLKVEVQENILQAIQKAHELSTTTMKERMNDLTGGLNLNLPGFDNSDS